MQISVIIPLFNCLPLTQAMVASLQATLPPGLNHEIILVDDGSTDGTREWLATLNDPPFRVLLNERNLGYAGANNRAARTATGTFLFFLNNDLVLQPGWFEPMRAAFDACANPGVIGNVQRSYATRRIDHRGVRFDPLDRPYHDQRRWPWIGRRPYSVYPAVTAACCAVARELFVAVGGFDEAYRNGYEDIDLCLRLSRAGHRHYVANHSVVLHHVSSSPGRFTSENENLKLLLRRWGKPRSPRQLGYFYLRRYWLTPWRYNGPKLSLALARLATNRRCDDLKTRWKIQEPVS